MIEIVEEKKITAMGKSSKNLDTKGLFDTGGLLPPETLQIERFGSGATNGVEGADAPGCSLRVSE